jgi:MoxR-like ATPase
VLTSNRTRELHDALKRRCLYHWIDYPTPEREREIVAARAPGVADAVAARVCTAVARLRDAGLYKSPGVGETIVWARALTAVDDLEATLGAALKVREDVERVRAQGVLEGV